MQKALDDAREHSAVLEDHLEGAKDGCKVLEERIEQQVRTRKTKALDKYGVLEEKIEPRAGIYVQNVRMLIACLLLCVCLLACRSRRSGTCRRT